MKQLNQWKKKHKPKYIAKDIQVNTPGKPNM